MAPSTETDDPLSSLVSVFQEPDTSPMFYVLSVVLFIFLLLLSALVSGSEVAFFTLTSEEKEKYHKSHLFFHRLIVKLTEKSKQLLATLVLTNYFITILISSIAVNMVWQLQQTADTHTLFIILLTLFSAFSLVFFGEVLPKVYAQKNHVFFLKYATGIVFTASFLFSPFIFILLKITHFIEHSLHKQGYKISVDELTQVLESNASITQTPSEKRFLQGVGHFSTISTRQIMRLRLDIVALPLELDFHELMDKINKVGYSRIPIYEETIDSISGILYIKDLLPYLEEDETFDWHQFLRVPHFTTENKKIDALLHDFQSRRVHLAIVVDEYGGTSGLVTMEDIIEEIVGDIQDEFDDENKFFTQIDSHTYVFESKILLNDFCKILKLEIEIFTAVRGSSESLGGLLLELFTRLPQTGEKTTYDPCTFVVLSADSKKIKRVKVTLAH